MVLQSWAECFDILDDRCWPFELPSLVDARRRVPESNVCKVGSLQLSNVLRADRGSDGRLQKSRRSEIGSMQRIGEPVHEGLGTNERDVLYTLVQRSPCFFLRQLCRSLAFRLCFQRGAQRSVLTVERRDADEKIWWETGERERLDDRDCRGVRQGVKVRCGAMRCGA